MDLSGPNLLSSTINQNNQSRRPTMMRNVTMEILSAMSSEELSEMRACASCDADIIPNSDISAQNIIAGTRRTRRYLRKRE